jgi:putative peptidoglycan lipid II flippase
MLGADFGLALAWAVPVAGIAQLGLVWMAAKRAGFRILPRWPRMTPELKQLAIIAAPAALAGGVIQVNLLVGRQVASFFEGSIQYLNLADRLYQLPLGVVAIAIGVVLLPELSRRLRAEDEVGGQASFNRATEFALLLTVPAAVALIAVPLPLVSVLFQRGAFTAQDAQATAIALAVYGLGLPSFVLQKVLQPLYFARADTRTPFRYAINGMIVNAVLAIVLAFWIGYVAAAIATSVSGWVMVWLLWRGSRQMGASAEPDERLTRRVWRIGLASLAMGAVLITTAALLEPWLYAAGLRYVALAVLLAAGLASYFMAGRALGAFSLSEIQSAVRRS